MPHRMLWAVAVTTACGGYRETGGRLYFIYLRATSCFRMTCFAEARLYGRNFRANKHDLMSLIHKLIDRYAKVRYHFIDYSDSRRKHLARAFFGLDWIPDDDSRGGAFYSCFDGIEECRGRFVLHLDSDMILGGAPRAWVRNAIEVLNSEPTNFVVQPLPGPPTVDFDLKQRYLRRQGRYRFVFGTMTGRVFLIDKQKFEHFKIPLRTIPYTMKDFWWRLRNNFSPVYERAEVLISEMMQKNGLRRIACWGENEQEGCFTLHLLKKPPAFIAAIPDILARIDSQNVPESQKGYYNVCNDFFDFSPYAKPSVGFLLREMRYAFKDRASF